MSPKLPSAILVECNNDETFVRAILGGHVAHHIFHYAGKSKVSERLQNHPIPATAMVDEDPNSVQPSYFESLGKPREFSSDELKLLHDRAKGHRIVIVRPRLEEWILATARLANVNVEAFGLPNNPARFKKKSSEHPAKLEKLAKGLATSPRLRRLKGLLSETPAAAYSGRRQLRSGSKRTR